MGILSLSLGVTVLVTFMAWVRTRHAHVLATRRSTLIAQLAAPGVIEPIVEAPIAVPIAVPIAKAAVPARAPVSRPATPQPLGYQLERLIDVYVAQAMQMTGTSRAVERRGARTPARGLATQIAKKLSHELGGVDAAPEELAVASQRLDEISDELLLEVSRLLEIDPEDVFEVTSDPVIEPPSLDADESGPLEPPTPRVAPASATTADRPPSDAWDESPSDPTIVDAFRIETEPSALRYLAITPPRAFGIEPTPPLPPARAPRASRSLTPITVVDGIGKDFDDEADTISADAIDRRRSSRRFAPS